MFINPSFWSFKHQPLVTVAFEYCLMVHVHWSRGGHHLYTYTGWHYLYTYKRNCKVGVFFCVFFFLILLICTMVSLVKGPFSTCLWWPLHLDNWYLSLCIGHGGDSHAVPVLLVKVKYSVYIIYIYIFSLFINDIIIDCASLV